MFLFGKATRSSFHCIFMCTTNVLLHFCWRWIFLLQTPHDTFLQITEWTSNHVWYYLLHVSNDKERSSSWHLVHLSAFCAVSSRPYLRLWSEIHLYWPLLNDICRSTMKVYTKFEWGKDFRPEYREMAQLRSFFKVPILAISVTCTKR